MTFENTKRKLRLLYLGKERLNAFRASFAPIPFETSAELLMFYANPQFVRGAADVDVNNLLSRLSSVKCQRVVTNGTEIRCLMDGGRQWPTVGDSGRRRVCTQGQCLGF